MRNKPIAVQMYTVRDAAAKDFLGALEKVAELGFTGVELAGLHGHRPSAVADKLTTLELACASAHVPLESLKNNLERELDTYAVLGAGYLVCPWLSPAERGDEADYRALARDLNRIGEQCRRQGFRLCYHHHDFELVRFGDRYALDILLEETDPALLQLEADTYWLKFGGEEPAAYIRRWPGRVPLLHFKDMSSSQPPTFAEVGSGILDWTSILEAASVGQAQWYIVEQDVCPGDPFESLSVSLDGLQTILRG